MVGGYGDEDEDGGRRRRGRPAAKRAPPNFFVGFGRLPPPPEREEQFVLSSAIAVSVVQGEEASVRALKAGDLLRPVWLEEGEEEDEGGGEGAEAGGAPSSASVGLALASDDDEDAPRVVATLRVPSSRAADALIHLCRPASALKGAVRAVVQVSKRASSSSNSSNSSTPSSTFSVSLGLTLDVLREAATYPPDQGYDDTRVSRHLLALLRWLRADRFAWSCSPSSSPSLPPSPQQPSSSSSPSPSASSPTLDAASLFAAIRPPLDAPRVSGWDSIAGLAPTLRPYQARAVGWMVAREEAEEGEEEEEEEEEEKEKPEQRSAGQAAAHPLWEFVSEEDGTPGEARARRPGATKTTATRLGSIFFNRVTGRVSFSSPAANAAAPRVRGGILADEMGLGKTVELLALILKQRQRAREEGTNGREHLWAVRRAERERRERVECPCGAEGPTSSADYAVLPVGTFWIQCDECDAWCHSSCCGLAQRRRPREEEGWACGACLFARAAEVVEGKKNNDASSSSSSSSPSSASASYSASFSGPLTTLIVCPTHIVGQWASELQRHADPGALKVVVYEGQGGAGGNGAGGGCGGKLVPRDDGGGGFDFVQREESGAAVLGGRYGGVVGAGDLAAADVVLVSYETLNREVFRSAEGEMGDAVVADPLSLSSSLSRRHSFRAPKRFAALPTPLTRLVWNRVVLDEAQEVESGATGAALLASRLAARCRWAVTGTPCGAGGHGGIDDLFGLFSFLRVEPWGVSQRVWREGLVGPAAAAWGSASANASSSSAAASAAARDRLIAAMAPSRGGLLWRSSKLDVAGELALPPQRQASTALELSAVERHFYDLMHARTARFARSVLPSGLLSAAAAAARRAGGGGRGGGRGASAAAAGSPPSSSSSSNRPLTKDEERKVLAPLTALRQACIHPSIGSRGLRLDGAGKERRGG